MEEDEQTQMAVFLISNESLFLFFFISETLHVFELKIFKLQDLFVQV